MNPREGKFNPKRRLAALTQPHLAALAVLAKSARYTGNPEHKRNPGDFNLTPPASPRRGKTLCDEVGIFHRSLAQSLLRQGLTKGLVDGRWSGEGWPQNIWAVTEGDEPLEAQHEGGGAYHGYPMPKNDPLRDQVLSAWRVQ